MRILKKGEKSLINSFFSLRVTHEFAIFIRVYMPLEKPTPEGFKVIYGKLTDCEPSHYVYNDCMKFFNMVLDLWLHTEGTTKGHIILVDLEGVVFGHAGRLSPMGLKKFLFYLQEGLPVRLQGLHFMNSVPVMEVILGMMKPFMKKELMDVVKFFNKIFFPKHTKFSGHLWLYKSLTIRIDFSRFGDKNIE